MNLNIFYGDNIGEFKDDYKINYQIPNCFLLEGQRTYRVEFDIYAKNSIKVEDITDSIEKELNYVSKKKIDWASFFLEGRYENNEKNIYRRTLVYEVRTY